MAKTVIFLGAGASVAEGASTQANLFIDYFRMKKQEEGIRDNHLVKYFKTFWKIDLNSDDLDFAIFPTSEEALGMLEMARQRREGFHGFYNTPNSNNIGHRIEDLIFLMAEILHEKLKQNIYHKELIDKLILQNRLTDIAFVSLNYDILIDNAIAAVHETMDLDYAVDFANFRAGDDWHAPRAERSIDLLKVHGSLNWLYCPVCKSIWLTPKQKGVIELVSRQVRPNKCKTCGGRYVPVLVPPTYFKEMSNPYLVSIWERIEKVLRECNQIIFCGYSLPDADIHIKYLLKRGQLNRKKQNLKVKVLNGRVNKDEEARYHRLFGNNVVEYLPVSFQDFAQSPEVYLG